MFYGKTILRLSQVYQCVNTERQTSYFLYFDPLGDLLAV